MIRNAVSHLCRWTAQPADRQRDISVEVSFHPFFFHSTVESRCQSRWHTARLTAVSLSQEGKQWPVVIQHIMFIYFKRGFSFSLPLLPDLMYVFSLRLRKCWPAGTPSPLYMVNQLLEVSGLRSPTVFFLGCVFSCSLNSASNCFTPQNSHGTLIFTLQKPNLCTSYCWFWCVLHERELPRKFQIISPEP